MESFVVLALYLKSDVISETVANLEPFLNISEEYGFVYNKFIVALKLFFVYHFLPNTLLKSYLTHVLLFLGNAYTVYRSVVTLWWTVLLHCVFLVATTEKTTITFCLFWIAFGVAVNITAYEFLLDAIVLVSMIFYALETYRTEIQKLATVISIQLTLGWYICSQSVFSLATFWLIVVFLLLAYIPLKPNWHNKHRNRLFYFYALMLVWVVYKFQLANHQNHQMLDFQTNISVIDKKWGYCALEGENSSAVLENAVISSEKFRATASVKNDFVEDPLEKFEKGSLNKLDVLRNTTFDAEFSKETCTTNSKSKNTSEEYAPGKRGEIFKSQTILQNTQVHEDSKDKVNFNSEGEPVLKLSAEVTEHIVEDSSVKDITDLQKFKQIGNESRIKKDTAQTAQEECESLSNVDHEIEFAKVDSNLRPTKLMEKVKISTEGEFPQNELNSQEGLGSMNINHEKEHTKDEFNLQEFKPMVKDKITTDEESSQNELFNKQGLESMNINHEKELTKDEFNLQEFKPMEKDKIATDGESSQNELCNQQGLKNMNVNFEKELTEDEFNLQEFKLMEKNKIEMEDVSGESTQNELGIQAGLSLKKEFPKDAFNMQKIKLLEDEIKAKEELIKTDFAARKELKSNLIEDEFDKNDSNVQESKLTESDIRKNKKSEVNKFNPQAELKSNNIVTEVKEFTEGHLNLQKDSKKEELIKEKNSLIDAAKKFADMKVMSNAHKDHYINTVERSMEEISKPMGPIKIHIKESSNSNNRKFDTKTLAKKGYTNKVNAPRHIKREDFNFIENKYLIKENEEMHENFYTTEEHILEDIPVTEAYEPEASETDGDQGMHLVYRHRRGKYYIL